MKSLSQKKPRFTPFDYTITVSRRQRHLVAASPELGLTVSAGRLDLGEPDPKTIGEAVIRVLVGVSQRLEALDEAGEAHPDPRPVRELLRSDVVSTVEAARLLRITRPGLRRLVELGAIRAERTPGGLLRFSLASLAEYLVRNEHDEGDLRA